MGHKNPSAEQTEERRNSHSPKKKIAKTMSACKNWLTNFKIRLKATRSRSRRQKKLLLLTWQNSERSNLILSSHKKEPISMSKFLQSIKPWVVEPLWDLFEE